MVEIERGRSAFFDLPYGLVGRFILLINGPAKPVADLARSILAFVLSFCWQACSRYSRY